MNRSRWFVNLTPRRRAPRRLFLFPFAGAGPYVFRPWVNLLPGDLSIIAVQLPGRGSRIRETPIRRLDQVLDQLEYEIGEYLDIPFSFFGHSMGALIMFECARRLRASGYEPEQMHVSAYPAPHIPFPYRRLHGLSETEFILEMRYLSGTPEQVLGCRDLLELVIPVLRADFEILEDYRYIEGKPFDCPLLVTGGTRDPIARREHLELWRNHAAGPFDLAMFEGNHFYYEQHREAFLGLVSRNLHGIRLTTQELTGL